MSVVGYRNANTDTLWSDDKRRDVISNRGSICRELVAHNPFNFAQMEDIQYKYTPGSGVGLPRQAVGCEKATVEIQFGLDLDNEKEQVATGNCP
jgi:hypothetical protein